VLRQLPLIICLFVVIDFLLLAAFTYWLGWKPALAENGLTNHHRSRGDPLLRMAMVGAVAKRLELEPGDCRQLVP